MPSKSVETPAKQSASQTSTTTNRSRENTKVSKIVLSSGKWSHKDRSSTICNLVLKPAPVALLENSDNLLYSSPEPFMGSFTSDIESPSQCSWCRCSPPSLPFLERCPHTPGGTTGCSCRRTGPNPPHLPQAGDNSQQGRWHLHPQSPPAQRTMCLREASGFRWNAASQRDAPALSPVC